MRNVKRIIKMINLIYKIWKKNPDLRLGQLIDNAINKENIFYIEDIDLERQLKNFYKEK